MNVPTNAPRISKAVAWALVLLFFIGCATVTAGASVLILRMFRWAILKC